MVLRHLHQVINALKGQNHPRNECALDCAWSKFPPDPTSPHHSHGSHLYAHRDNPDLLPRNDPLPLQSSFRYFWGDHRDNHT